MPELPDVEVFRRHAAATSLHKRIERVRVLARRLLEDATPQSIGRLLNGRQFERTHRHGKYLLMETTDRCLVLHFGMSGGLRFVDGSPLPNDTCAALHFAANGCLAYRSSRLLGRIFVVKNREELIQSKQLGPDVLQVDVRQFCERVSKKKGALKGALMDQSLFAGIGNVYSDEILFHVRLHPNVNVRTLGDRMLGQLYESCRQVLETAIRCHAEPDQMPSSYLLPHRDSDHGCPRCGMALKKSNVGGRSAVFCRNCQAL